MVTRMAERVFLYLSLFLCTLACTQACRSSSCSAVNCRWSVWGGWGPCSAGRQTRGRYIATSPTCGGAPCVGSWTESRTCNIGGDACEAAGGKCQFYLYACNGYVAIWNCGTGNRCCIKNANSGLCSRSRQVSRAGWGAAAYKSRSNISVPVEYVFIHHTATPTCTSDTTCKQRVKSIQNHHQTQNKWSDIGYNWLVGEDGRAYEGRNWPYEGAHTKGYNNVSVAVSVIGNYVTVSPNAAALQAVQDIIACGVDEGYIAPNYELFGHKDAGSTTCPGSSLYNVIKTWPRFSTRTIRKYKR